MAVLGLTVAEPWPIVWPEVKPDLPQNYPKKAVEYSDQYGVFWCRSLHLRQTPDAFAGDASF